MSKPKRATQNTRATVLHRDLKLECSHFHATMKHPVHGRNVKVFRAAVKDFDPMTHADQEVYYYKDKGHRYTVDMVAWLSKELHDMLRINPA